jgi:S1-C subfamily serine protease
VIALDAHGKILTSTTGFFVSENGDIITFHRPLLRASRIEIKTADGKTGSVVGVVSENSEADLVRLSTTLTNSPVVLSNMAKSLPRENEKVIVLGAKRAVEVRALDVAEMPLFGNVFTAQLSPSAEFMGAPIVNVDAELVGLITSIQRKSHAVALSNDCLRRLPPASPKPSRR